MQLNLEESRPGKYDVYSSSDGETYIVIDGLDVNQIHKPYGLEAFMLNNYDVAAGFYWILILATFVFLIGKFIVTPLYNRFNQGLPILED